MKHQAEKLLANLFVELFQHEESAREHSRIEAERIAGTAPADALIAVSVHAQRTGKALELLARQEGLALTNLGARIGNALSAARDFLLDRTVSREKSYRGTLIGMRHGIDLVSLMRAVAETAERPRVVSFCDQWLEERTPLVAKVASELEWFASAAAIAMQRATRPFDSRLATST